MAAFEFRRMTRQDVDLVHRWRNAPHVSEWWHDAPTRSDVEEDYLGDVPSSAHVALYDGKPMGFVQSYVAMGSGDGWWEHITDPGVRGIDQFIGEPDLLNRGLGTAMIRAFVATLLCDPAVTMVQTDPSVDNARAIRCYEKAGFVSQGEIETPDGRARYMTLTRADFERASDFP